MFVISSYFSVEYLLILLPACVLFYLLLPKTGRRLCLLIFSCAFFWAVSGRLIVYLLAKRVRKKRSGRIFRNECSGSVCLGSFCRSERSSW